jgi:hypothetical protein
MSLKHTPQRAAPPWRWIVFAALALLLIILTARAAAAENLGPGGSRVIVGDEVVGAYRLLVTSSPNPATTGTVTFVVRVTDPQSSVTVKDAQVEVELTSGAASIKQAATHENAGNPVDYAAHIEIPQEGSWNGLVRVAGPAGASEAAFLQHVSAPRTANTVILVGIPFGAILLVFVALWMARSRGREDQDASAAQALRK